MPGELKPGEQVGPYTLDDVLGRGGMGVVFRARHTQLGHEVALKLIHSEDSGDKESRARFRREAQAAARLSDIPGVVGVQDFGEEADGRLWFAMPVIDGESVEDLIVSADLGVRRSVQIVADAARAVHAAHERGVLHRDLKPANILVASSGETRVTDFGLARFTAADDAVTKLTKTGYFVGTPSYMSPEQVFGTGMDRRADVYGLAATLYDLLTGDPPFKGPTDGVTLTLVLRMDPPRPGRANPEVPKELDGIVLRGLEKDPAARYPTALAFAEDLTAWLDGRPVSADPPSLQRTVRRFVRRRKWEVAATVVGVLAIGSVGGHALWAAGQAPPPSQGPPPGEVVTDAERALQYVAAWERLRRVTGPQLRVLEDRLQGVAMRDIAVEDQLRMIRHATAAVARDEPALGLPVAWEGLALVLAGQTAPGMELLDQAASKPDAALVHLVRARAHLARLVTASRLPQMRLDARQASKVALAENDASREARNGLRHALQQAREDPLWRWLPSGSAYQPFADALDELLEGRPRKALPHLAALGDHPELAAPAAMLHGMVLFLLQPDASAVATWRRAVDRGWPQAIRMTLYATLALAQHPGTGAEARAAGFRTAAELLARLRASEGETAEWHADRGSVALMRAMVAGASPDPADLDAAAAAFAESHRRNDRLPTPLSNLAITHLLRARAAAYRGKPSDALYRTAIRAYDRYVEQAGGDGHARGNRAIALIEYGRLLAASGADGVPLFEKAVADCTAAIAGSNPQRDDYSYRAAAYHAWGRALADRGRDPLPLYERALEDLDARVKLQHVDRFPLVERASVHLSIAQAVAARDRKRSFRELSAALRDATLVIDRLAADAEVRVLRARIIWEMTRGDGPAKGDIPAMRNAERDLTHAGQDAPGDARVWMIRGHVRIDLAKALRAHGELADKEQSGAIEDYGTALRCNPRLFEARAARGEALSQIAREDERAGRDPEPAFTKAMADYDALLQAVPRNATYRILRGRALHNRAESRHRRGQSPKSDLVKAIADFDLAIESEPKLWKGHFMRGLAVAVLGRFDDALASLATAKQLAPRNALIDAAIRQTKQQQAAAAGD